MAGEEREAHGCGDCGHPWAWHLDWPGACSECVCQSFLHPDHLAAARRDPEPVASADAAWEMYDSIIDVSPDVRLAFRRQVEAAIRGTEASPLDVEWLARAQDICDRRHHDPEHGPYRGLDNDPILASMMREEAAELAAEYARLSAPTEPVEGASDE